MLEEIKGRVERRQYDKITEKLKMHGPNDDQEMLDKQKFRFTLAYGYGFISLMFIAFVCGYCLGKFIFELN